MIITRDMLINFYACKNDLEYFCELYPNGLDVSGLWGTFEERKDTWKKLLSNKFLRQEIGWAIGMGLIPSKIVGDFADMNLAGANLCDANLCGSNLRNAILTRSNLRRANLTRADLFGANLFGVDLRWANLGYADLRRANLFGADLRKAIISDEQRYYAIEHGAICR